MATPIPDEFLDLMAEKFRMLADPTRLAILRALMAGERSVSQVIDETGRNQANVSKHLKMLAEAGLVGPPQEGFAGVFKVTGPPVARPARPAARRAVPAGLRSYWRGGPRGDGPPEEAARRLEGSEDEVVTADASASSLGRLARTQGFWPEPTSRKPPLGLGRPPPGRPAHT